MLTLNQILIDTNSYLDLTASLPTGDDLTVRINYANQAIREWADAYQWRQLKTYFCPTVLTENPGITLPENFRSLLAPPHEIQGTNYIEYPEIMPEERYSLDSTTKYSYILGNDAEGRVLYFNGLSSGATVSVDFQRLASTMATYTDVCEVPDSQYVKLKTISYVLQSRSDERFPIVDSEANRILANMVGREMIQRPGGYNVPRKYGSAKWKIGTSRGV